MLLATFPVVFLYHENAGILNLSSMVLPLGVHVLLAVAAYTFLYFLCKRNAVAASNASVVFLLVFILYGTIYDLLLTADLFTVRHGTMLPVMLVAGGYLAYFVERIAPAGARSVQRASLVLTAGLIGFNAAGVLRVEYYKLVASREGSAPGSQTYNDGSPTTRPDIYYIVLDEFAGFDAVREYWGYDEIDEFENHLEERGFFVAGGSRSTTIDTLVEISSRLNYQEYPAGEESAVYFDAIADNRIMRDLSSLGYTTVALEELRSALAYAAATPIAVDYDLHFDPGSSRPGGLRFDPFAAMVFELTMLRPVAEADRLLYGMYEEHGQEVLWALDRLANLDDIPSPKFVYAHLLFPHAPWIFDRNGAPTVSSCWYDWNCYLDTYIFSVSQARELVDQLMGNADPLNPPIIILQSDHGARNDGGTTLTDYPAELRNHILNALYLPGFDYSQLKVDMDPIDTFPLILNHYFDTDLPLRQDAGLE